MNIQSINQSNHMHDNRRFHNLSDLFIVAGLIGTTNNDLEVFRHVSPLVAFSLIL